MHTALIAEDELLLAADLQSQLGGLWPELRIAASVRHGDVAVQQALALQPDVLFLDIQMPGTTGLEAARAVVEDWPEGGKSLPLIVFVTAYDEYAVQAFGEAAADYVLKPVRRERLAQTCARLQAALRGRHGVAPAVVSHAIMAQLRALIATHEQASTSTDPLRIIQAGTGNLIHMVPVDEVLFFEAADKYVRVVTTEREHLVRASLRELFPRLDAHRFWQVHRSTIVRCDAIASALRDDSGKLSLTLHGHPAALAVSRMYAHRFRGM